MMADITGSIARLFGRLYRSRYSSGSDDTASCRDVSDSIDDYISGRLTEVQAKKIDIHLLKCGKCSKLLEERLTVGRVLKQHSEEIFNGLVDERIVASKKPHKFSLYNTNKWHILAIAACILLAIPLYLGYLKNLDEPENLAEIRPYPYIPHTVRGFGDKRDRPFEKFQQGMRLYQDKAYAEALPYLERAAVAEPDNIEYLFYLGITSLLDDRIAKAITLLEKANTMHSGLVAVKWYLANAYLKQGDSRKALEILEEVIQTDDLYHMEAITLSEKIREKTGIRRE
jgi:tetratricopeptide (TPR) repeat protein